MQSTVVVDHDTKRRKAVLEALFGNLRTYGDTLFTAQGTFGELADGVNGLQEAAHRSTQSASESAAAIDLISLNLNRLAAITPELVRRDRSECRQTSLRRSQIAVVSPAWFML